MNFVEVKMLGILRGMVRVSVMVPVSVVILSMGLVGCKDKKELVIFNWSDYISEDVIRGFEKETGVKVRLATYNSNEELYTKLKQGNSIENYDIIFPSLYYLARMMDEGLVEPLDYTQIDGMENITEGLISKDFAKYSVPYFWGYTGLIYNSTMTSEPLDSWTDLQRDEFRNKLLLFDDPREMFAMGLLATGSSNINSKNNTEIDNAYQFILGLKHRARVFTSDLPVTPFVMGDTSAGIIYNGEAKQVIDENPDMEFIVPKEGGVVWMDVMALPANSRDNAIAYQFISYLLRGDINLELSREYGYSSPNIESINLMTAEERSNEVIYPSDATRERLQYILDVGDYLDIYSEYWDKIKSAK